MADDKTTAQKLAEQTYQELGYDPKTNRFSKSPDRSYPAPLSSYHMTQPKTPFRVRGLEKTAYQSKTGTTYKYSALYRNAVVLQFLIEKWLTGLDPRKYHRLITQDTDAARSMVANIAEGYARPTTREYLDFLGYSKASLEEITTDVVHAKDTGILPSRPGSSLAGIGIVLRPTPSPNLSYLSPKTSYDPLGELKRTIGGIRREHLSFEIIIELINKTNYLYKRTVEGLWRKLSRDEQNLLRGKLHRFWS